VEKNLPKIDPKGSVELVTGANRGIGRAYVEALVKAGARKVYATARKAESVQDLVAAHPGVVEVFALDISDPAQIANAAAKASDVTVLINNAGVANGGFLLAEAGASGMRKDVAVNVFGTTDMIRAFAPVLQANGGGAIVVLNSIASLVNFPLLSGYSASKAALHSVTQGVRAELAHKGTLVTGVYPGPIDTAMAEPIDMPKEPPSAVADATLTALANGDEEVFPDAMAKDVAKNFKADWKALEKSMAAMVVPA
jgi:NAD(P)-dependent dehydrogenase (short-subunit alcohol dehydrogenase family)